MALDPKAVAIAFITYYPRWYSGPLRSIKHTDKVRGDLALQSLTEGTRLGYQIVVVDGKSAKSFKKALTEFHNIKVVKRKTQKRSPSKRIAIKICAKLPGVKTIVLNEPEKVGIITKCMEQIAQPILDGKADIVVPKRPSHLFGTSYPSYMYESEVEGNKIYNEALRTHGLLPYGHEDLDMMFGPRAFANDKKVIALFMKRYSLQVGKFLITTAMFDPEEYSNAQFFPIIQALKKKMRVLTVAVPFSYPTIQKENEEIGEKEAFLTKRRMQRLSILVDLIHFLSYLEHKPESKMKALP